MKFICCNCLQEKDEVPGKIDADNVWCEFCWTIATDDAYFKAKQHEREWNQRELSVSVSPQ